MDQEMIAMLTRWQQLTTQLAAMKTLVEEEAALRKSIFAKAFPTPKEGVNNFALNDGFVLKGTYKITRKLDEAALPAVLARLRELQVPVDSVIRYAPELATTAYKALPDVAKAIMDEVITSKPASPTLELVQSAKV